MKMKVGAIAALLVSSQAFGQATPTAVGGVSTSDNSSALSNIGASYTGIYSGPSLDKDALDKTTGGDNQSISHRPNVKYKFNPNLDAGVQARVITEFAEDGIKAYNDRYRIFSNVKNIVKTQETSLTLTPRIALPTSNASHDQHLLMAPELIATYSIEPSDSRISLELGSTLQAPIYHGSSANPNGRMNFYVAPWFAANYQMSPKLQASVGIYPEFIQSKSDILKEAANELDVGVSWDVAKGINLNPYVGTNLDANQLENSSLNLVLSASLL